ncbi:MAG: hypothetical protein ACOCX4_04180, partial [Planctomycetota bacterium]
MADETSEFSLHEMEQLKRRMAETRAPEASAAQAPGDAESASVAASTASAPVSGSAPAVPSPDAGGSPHLLPDAPPQGTFSQHAVDADAESLQIRRALRVLRRHWLAIGLIALFVPAVVAFTDLYVRDKIYRASAIYERLDEAELSTLRIGMMTISAKQSETDDVQRMLHSDEVNKHLRELLAQEADRREERLAEIADPVARAAEETLIARLRKMHADQSAYREFRGSLSARNTSESLVQISVTGRYEHVHRVVADLVIGPLNEYARRHREEQVNSYSNQLNELLEQNQKQIESTRQKLANVNEAIEVMDADVGKRFSVTQRLESLLFEQRMATNEIELELRLLRQEADWEKLKARFGIADEKQIDEVQVQGNPLREKWREYARQKAQLETRYLPEHPRMKEVERSIRAIRTQLKEQGNLNGRGEVPPLPSEQEERVLQRLRQQARALRLARSRVEETTESLRRERQEELQIASGQALSPEESQRLRKLRDERDALV